MPRPLDERECRMKESKAQKIATLLKVLANENRLLILCALERGAQNVTDLQQKIPTISQSALSQHLALLRAHQIIAFQKKGQYVTYHIADLRVKEVLKVLGEHYCEEN